MTFYPVELHGSNVVLRELGLGDVDSAAAIIGDDRVTRYLSFDSRTRQQAHAMITGAMQRARLDPRTEYYLAVAPPRDGHMVGFARLELSGVKAAKLGYAIDADAWGRGYATDACRTMCGSAFGKLDLHRVSAAIGPDNARSIRLIERLGFTYEGRIRDHVFTNGRWRDSLLYSILDDEWARSGDT